MHVVGIGDNVVDRYLHLNRMFPGGNALNVSVFALRAGADAAYIGALGDDAAGRHVLQALQEEGINTARTRVVHGPNAYADVSLVDGDRTFVGGSDGVSMFVPNAEDLALLRTADLVHSSVYSGLDDWVQANRGDLPISFDFSDCIGQEYVAALAPGLVCALFSGAGLDDGAAEDLVTGVAALGVRDVLMTRGARGAIAYAEGRCWAQPALPTQVIDTLGAGDAFVAAFLVARLRSAAIPEALRLGAVAAANACTYYGAIGHGAPITGDSLTTGSPHLDAPPLLARRSC